ncbi:protein adenylyltransferase SelO [Niallia sp. Krafla_26]|uniref:protein adenylyltransferase SelO n=1 Tax=Niallia sp. Krafla_26 TaxID=3064703 RepID=UPI003D175B6F
MNREKTHWNFDNSYQVLPKILFKNQTPTPVKSPELIVMNGSLAETLGLSVEHLQSEEGINVFVGNQIPENSVPIAQAYAGHQFGHFAMLGDGRAVLLGEQITPDNRRYDIQLKGSGRTPFSRGGDGRAALGPMLREYIISEAMHGLGIPTTRSLAVVTTGEPVYRETILPGAVLTRVASSHIRVGTFQYAANWGSRDVLQNLADYTIDRHYPEFENQDNRYLTFLRRVIERQAKLISKWQLVGFIHGVMNTDNMTVSGETIDYGPCAFMDQYDPATVFSSIDREGRYAYGNQPSIGAWNLARFAEALLPLLNENQEKAIEIAEGEIAQYFTIYNQYWLAGMRAKLGIMNEEPDDEALVNDLLQLMQEYKSDYTNTFRSFTLDKLEGEKMFSKEEFKKWYKRWQERLSRQKEPKEEVLKSMRNHNPAIIPRNHQVEEALNAAVEKGDMSVMNVFLDALAKPYSYTKEQEKYCQLPTPSNQPYQTFCGT